MIGNPSLCAHSRARFHLGTIAETRSQAGHAPVIVPRVHDHDGDLARIHAFLQMFDLTGFTVAGLELKIQGHRSATQNDGRNKNSNADPGILAKPNKSVHHHCADFVVMPSESQSLGSVTPSIAMILLRKTLGSFTVTGLNEDEKCFRLSVTLPVDESRSETVQKRDLMIYDQDRHRSFAAEQQSARVGLWRLARSGPDGFRQGSGRG